MDLATILTILFTKVKVYFYGFITGGVIQYFEFQINPESRFSLAKFVISCSVLGFLTVFSNIFLMAYMHFEPSEKNIDEKVFVLSIVGATFLYLVIPFVLSKENRGKFIISVLEKFGFRYITDEQNERR